jgi:hypothetical protein
LRTLLAARGVTSPALPHNLDDHEIDRNHLSGLAREATCLPHANCLRVVPLLFPQLGSGGFLQALRTSAILHGPDRKIEASSTATNLAGENLARAVANLAEHELVVAIHDAPIAAREADGHIRQACGE